ncbi:TPA: IS30 family transposase [Staphylococcus aureus]|nr:IS30 family transposase [Staphylococcus aureus]
MDTIWSIRPSKYCLLTVIERKTRYLYAKCLPTRQSNVVCSEIVNILKDLNPKSITMDRGKEFALFEMLEKDLKCDIYFSDLGCPYQRGSIENANGLLRQYFPKGTDFKNVSEASLRIAVEQINKRPRMIFDYITSEEMLKMVMAEQNCKPVLNDCVRDEPVN